MTRRALLTLLTLLVAACLALGAVLSPGMYLLAKEASQPKTTQTAALYLHCRFQNYKLFPFYVIANAVKQSHLCTLHVIARHDTCAALRLRSAGEQSHAFTLK